ncbi:MAG: hypothetical protein HYZ69_03260 [Candidatus Colwellbacteria bacterium]|nr:hypothetical protein [Candidatus Colwellbacteria bacterium]
MDNRRPVDAFVKRSMGVLQKEYLVIGKRRISSFTAWAVIAFFIGATIAVGFLASRSGTLEGSEAARAARPVWSRWGNWKEGSTPLGTSTVQYRPRAKTSTQVVNGKKTRLRTQGYEKRQCVKNCESLAGAQFQQQGQQNQFVGSTGCTTYNLGGETPSLPAIQAFNNRLVIALRGNAASGYGVYVKEVGQGGSVLRDWYWVNQGSTSDAPQLKIEGNTLAMYIKGYYQGQPLDQTYKTTQAQGQPPGTWNDWTLSCDSQSDPNTTCAITPGPATATLQGTTYC